MLPQAVCAAAELLAGAALSTGSAVDCPTAPVLCSRLRCRLLARVARWPCCVLLHCWLAPAAAACLVADAAAAAAKATSGLFSRISLVLSSSADCVRSESRKWLSCTTNKAAESHGYLGPAVVSDVNSYLCSVCSILRADVVSRRPCKVHAHMSGTRVSRDTLQ
jgi:hypothetical protein